MAATTRAWRVAGSDRGSLSVRGPSRRGIGHGVRYCRAGEGHLADDAALDPGAGAVLLYLDQLGIEFADLRPIPDVQVMVHGSGFQRGRQMNVAVSQSTEHIQPGKRVVDVDIGTA